MTKEGKSMIFCAEQYKYAKKLTGRQLDELFSIDARKPAMA